MKTKKVVALMAAVLMGTTAMSAFGACGGTEVKNDSYDTTKANLSVATFDGGVGRAWLQDAAARFEAKYANATHFQEGRVGVKVSVDGDKCTECGRCYSVCKMDISKVGDVECIQCGDCIPACPTSAIYRRGLRFLIDPGTPDGKIDEKTAKKNRLGQRIVAALLAVILVGALVYYNFIDKAPEAVVNAEKEKAAKYAELIAKLEESAKAMQA